MARKTPIDIVFDISQLFASSDNFEDICQKVVDTVVHNFRFSGAVIFLYDKDGKYIYPLTASKTTIIQKVISLLPMDMKDLKINLTRQGNLVVRSFVDKKQYMSERYKDFAPPQVYRLADYIQLFARIKCACAVPILYKDETLGVLLFATHDKEFDDDDFHVMQVFANIAGTAIQNWHLSHELEEKIISLEKSNKFKTELLEIASHELRTPATIIRDALSMIDESDKNEYLHYARMATARQLLLVNNMLSSSMIESNALILQKSKFDINLLIRKLAEELRLFILERKIKIEVQCEGKMQIVADEQKISQVIYNILYNATKFTKKGSITIATAREEKMIHITIADTGRGMTENELHTLFGKYTYGKLKPDKKTFGVGIGLYICQYIIQRHGGTINVESKKGEGSIFNILLPIS